MLVSFVEERRLLFGASTTLMLIGYARVSTDEQKLDLQLDALERAGCAQVFSDTLSGARTDRPGLEKVLSLLTTGDTLVVWKLDRMGRSLKHLVSTIDELQAQGIQFRSLQESLDTNTPGGRLVFHVFAALAEFERDLISERTKAGLEAARRRGRRGGATYKLDASQIQTLVGMGRNNVPVPQICATLNISRATYFRYKKIARAAEISEPVDVDWPPVRSPGAGHSRAAPAFRGTRGAG